VSEPAARVRSSTLFVRSAILFELLESLFEVEFILGSVILLSESRSIFEKLFAARG